MKIAIIMPGELPYELQKPLSDAIKRVLSSGTQFTMLPLPGARIKAAGDIDLLAPVAAEAAKNAEKKGFEAVVLNGV